MPRLPTGKLDPALLERLLRGVRQADPSVLIGARIGDDAAAIRPRGRILVLKTDPITFVAERMGWYSVVICANDLAVMGAVPRWFLATVLLPDAQGNDRVLWELFRDLRRALRAHGITLVGGHTEVTPGLARPMIVGQMVGEATGRGLVRKDRIRAGDDIVLVKGVAIEGTVVIGQTRAAELRRSEGATFVRHIQRFIDVPGISVVGAARAAQAVAPLTGMHDPTEGGLLGGVWELASLAGCGFALDRAAVPVYPECARLCARYGLDPLRLIASGALVITVRPRYCRRLLRGLATAGFPARKIGVMEPVAGARLCGPEGDETLVPPFRDHITLLFDQAETGGSPARPRSSARLSGS